MGSRGRAGRRQQRFDQYANFVPPGFTTYRQRTASPLTFQALSQGMPTPSQINPTAMIPGGLQQNRPFSPNPSHLSMPQQRSPRPMMGGLPPPAGCTSGVYQQKMYSFSPEVGVMQHSVRPQRRNSWNKHQQGTHGGQGPPAGQGGGKFNVYCAACKRPYDLSSRAPLMLECNHLMCEYCLRSKLTSNGIAVACSECNASVTLEVKVKSDFNVREYFPVNYYLAGKLYFNRFEDRAVGNFQFLPVAAPVAVAAATQESVMEKCATKECKKEATLRCLDCEEVYCVACSEKLHSLAKGLMQHRISSTTIAPCAMHPGNPLDFYCATCSASLCTYCILDAHKDHNFKQVTKLAVGDMEKFNKLLNGCKEMLKRLKETHELVQKKVAKGKPKGDTNLEKTIATCFHEIHGKLQQIETRLLREAASMSDGTLESLKAVELELRQNMAVVQDLVTAAEGVVKQQQRSDLWHNVELLMQRMANAGDLPHALHMQEKSNDCDKSKAFRFDDFTADLETFFHLNKAAGRVFELTVLDADAAHVGVEEGLLDECSSTISRITIDQTGNRPIVSGERGFQPRQDSKDDSTRFETFQPIRKSSDSDVNSSFEDGLLNVTPINFTENSLQNVVVSHIISPGKFYVQLVKHFKNVQDLHKRLQFMVEKLYVAPVRVLALNQMYLAKCNVGFSSYWRRGIVKIINPDKPECLVHFIDYGNSDSVHIQDLRKITEEVALISPFAFECKLYDLVEPPGQPWNDTDATLMADMISGADAKIEIKNIVQTCFEVDLHIHTRSNDFSMRISLLFLGRAKSYNDDDVEAIDTCPSPGLFISEKLMYHEEPLKIGGITVQIVTVVDAVTFYVQNCSYKDYIQQLKITMQTFYNNQANLKSEKLYAPSVDAGVAVRVVSSDDQNLSGWYRGLILEVYQGEGKMKVLLVDSGDEEIVTFGDVYTLNKQFISCAKMANKVRLADVSYKGKKQNLAGIAYLNNLKSAGIFNLQIHRELDVPEVILFDKCAAYDLCINAQIVKTAGLVSTGFISKHMEWPRHDSNSEADGLSVTASLLQQSQRVSSDEEDDVEEDESAGLHLEPIKVLHITDPHCIYLHPIETAEFREKLSKLDLRFQRYQVTHELITRDEWNVDDLCVAYNKISKQYWRAKVTQRMRSNQYEVIGIDFGKAFILEGDAMGELSDEFADIPGMAVVVRLYGIKPMGKRWSLTASDFLQDLLVGKLAIFMTRLKTTSKENNLPVVMWTRKTKMPSALERTKIITKNVNRIICKHGLGVFSSDWSAADVCASIKTKSSLSTPKKVESSASSLVASSYNRNCDERKGWTPAPCIDECIFQAVATYVDESGYIYFHDLNDMTTLKQLEQSIFERLQWVKPVLNVTWEVGNACTVIYHRTLKYYRGTVLGINDDEKQLRVQMIDYGNVEDCGYHEVWKQVHFLDIPIVAKKVRMYNVRMTSDYPTSVLDTLHALIVDKVVDLEIMEQASTRRPASAKVRCGKINVNAFAQGEIDKFQMHGEATGAQVAPPLVDVHTYQDADDSDDDVVIEEVIRGNGAVSRGSQSSASRQNKQPKSGKPGVLKFNYIDLPTDEYFSVSIVNVVHVNAVVFELEGYPRSTTTFEELQRDINTRWQQQFVIPAQHLRENQVCIARYNVDHTWYRAKAVQCNGVMSIHFVDYGNIEVVGDCEELRKMKPDWMAHPVEQIYAYLSDFRLLSQSHKLLIDPIQRHLLEYIETAKLAKISSRNPLSVQLFDPDTGKIAYEDVFNLTSFKQTQGL